MSPRVLRNKRFNNPKLNKNVGVAEVVKLVFKIFYFEKINRK